MSFSLEEQLKLFDPSRFEELCAQLVKQDFLESRHVEGAGGDEGIDIFAGELDEEVRARKGSKLHVWQAKFFRDGVKRRQREKAEKSLERVIAEHKPDFWTLCVPVKLDMHGQRWFNSLKARHPGITLDIWQADEITRRMRQDKSLIDSYFLRQQPKVQKEILNEILRSLEDFESVPDLVKRAALSVKDASDFYNGAIPVWSDIVQGFDAPREQFGKLWQFVASHVNNPGGRVPFALITGRSGDGKSTVLMRLAAQLANQGCELAFYCKDDAQSLRVEQFHKPPCNSTYILIIDKITRFDTDTLRGFFERLYRDFIPVVVIGAARLSLWEGLGLKSALANVAHICEVSLEEITDDDIEALLNKWSADPSRAVEYLGALAGLPREKQMARFHEKAKRQLLVALLEVKHNRVFEAYVRGELRELESRFGSQIRRACTYVSALHRLDVPMPRNLLQRLLPSSHLYYDVLRHTRGLLAEMLTKPGGIITRHALIAEVIFNSPYVREYGEQRVYENIINSAEPKHQHRIGWALRLLVLRGEVALADGLLTIASQRFPSHVVFLHMHAMLCRSQGNTKRARELFQKAAKIDPRHAPTWQAWAESVTRHNIGDLDKEFAVSVLEEIFGMVDEGAKERALVLSTMWYSIKLLLDCIDPREIDVDIDEFTDLKISALCQSLKLSPFSHQAHPSMHPARQALANLGITNPDELIRKYDHMHHYRRAQSLQKEKRAPFLEIFHRIFSAAIVSRNVNYLVRSGKLEDAEKQRRIKRLSGKWGYVGYNASKYPEIPHSISTRCCELSVKIDPENLASWHSLGWKYFDDGTLDKAFEAFEKNLEIEEKAGRKYSHLSKIGLGRIYEAKGDVKSAARLFKDGANLAVGMYAKKDPNRAIDCLIKAAQSLSDLESPDSSKDDEITALGDALKFYKRALNMSQKTEPPDTEIITPLQEKISLLERRIKQKEEQSKEMEKTPPT